MNSFRRCVSIVLVSVFGFSALPSKDACEAATVTLSVQVSDAFATSGTWEAYAQVFGTDNVGLASFNLDVTGSGGISITSSQVRAPATLSRIDPFTSAGLSEIRRNGTNGLQITAAQPVFTNEPNRVIEGIGLVPGSADFTADGGLSISWGMPALIASGTYSNDGRGGSITAAVHPGSFFQLLAKVNGDHWMGPGNVLNATTVAPGSIVTPVPEPTAAVVIGAGVFVACLARRPTHSHPTTRCGGRRNGPA
jgi:hypothetical protein